MTPTRQRHGRTEIWSYGMWLPYPRFKPLPEGWGFLNWGAAALGISTDEAIERFVK